MDSQENEGPIEIAFVGDLTDSASDLHEKLIGTPHGGECLIYFDSPGGSPYSAISLMNLILIRDLSATAVVTGECSSAALWPFAACQRRIVTPFSVLLFHPMRWQSEENVVIHEANEWARHFGQLESQMDGLLSELLPLPLETLNEWMRPGRYLRGPELADAGLAELVDPRERDLRT
jgi:ATP-dependent Clp protease protease subunit